MRRNKFLNNFLSFNFSIVLSKIFEPEKFLVLLSISFFWKLHFSSNNAYISTQIFRWSEKHFWIQATVICCYLRQGLNMGSLPQFSQFSGGGVEVLRILLENAVRGGGGGILASKIPGGTRLGPCLRDVSTGRSPPPVATTKMLDKRSKF